MTVSTTFLTLPAHQLLGTQIVYAEKYVDFTVENVTSGNGISVLRLPKGAIPLAAGWHVGTTQATVEFALACPTASLTLKSAAAMGSAAAMAWLTASDALGADDTMDVTVSAANCTTAKVTFFCVYAVSDVAR